MTSTSRGLAGTLLSVGLPLIAMASIRSGTSLAKSAPLLVGIQSITVLRLFFIVLILLLPPRPWRKCLSLQSLRLVMVYGIALGGMNLLFYLSVHTVSPGIAVALEFTGPLLAVIPFSWCLLNFLRIGLTVFGVWLSLPLGNSVEPLSLADVAYTPDAGVCWALYILSGRRADADHGAQGAVPGVLVAAILVVPIGIAHTGADLLDPALILLALDVAVFPTALPCTLEMVAPVRPPARIFGTLMSTEPAFGALSGLLFLGERLSPTQWLVIGTIIFTSVGTTLSVKSCGVAPALLAKD